jgi:hypothetical protein
MASKNIYVSLPAPKKRKRKKFWLIGIISSFVLGIFTISGGWGAIKDFFTPKHEIYMQENFIRGFLIPDEILYSSKRIEIIAGSVLFGYSISEFKEGLTIDINHSMKCIGENAFKISFKLKNHRLYAQDTITDFNNEKLIGYINYDRWQIKNGAFFNYYTDDYTLEVKDNSGNIVLSMMYLNGDRIYIQGYYMGEDIITVVNEGVHPCMDKRLKDIRNSALKEIKKIKAIHVF